MTDGVSREDLRDSLRDMQASINRGFDGVHARLDKLNGQVADHGKAIAVQEERWRRLDKATTVSATDPIAAGVKPDWKVLASIGAVIGGMVYGLWQAVMKVSVALAGK